MADSDSPDERLTIYADYVCPFCYLGRQSLARYQETREEPVEIDWQPFDLRSGKRGPDGEIDHGVPDGKDEEYFEQARENVRRLQERYGVEMAQEIATEVDSLPAQAASLTVKEIRPERWADLDGAIYAALWKEGRDIGDREVLSDVIESVGLDPEEVLAASEDEDLRARLAERFTAAREQGVTGVPTFAYGGYAARGAVPPEQLERLVEGA
ncbi:DsbA family oxidoreductase [Halalkalicoccus jeotgali]|uniref:DSBA oxidoreductase n=1 Tax=Halalkalicoccus jeotgali (strain DSM 18796 / CECT 7217 / JCM 14584 / KCTC 4019 / B3) TaxID=795797 RepID=D8J715_HALJB|nr:DsbA family protein [Halalkalicoccus jeotgali]ADJ15968.1 DSBA oxidoreductase [Halalkalicoccus jeotgali B3]ELY38064.1 DSBA oxidoreductase [Halalkalicoccus jeotgali B3]